MKSKKIVMSVLGVIITGIHVGFFKLAAFGVDPFQTLAAGLDWVIPLPFGTVYVLINVMLLLFAIIFDRHCIGIATVINMLFLGYIIEFTYGGLQKLFPAPPMALKIFSLGIGFVGLCFGSSLYMTADLGVSAYDSVAIILSGKWHLGKFKFIRILTDSACVILGTVLILADHGTLHQLMTVVGAGTILTAACMGPLIDYFNRRISIPFLNASRNGSADSGKNGV